MQGEVAEDVIESVRAWVAGWGEEVAGLDFAGGRARFAADVVAFGTKAHVVTGLDALYEQQWSQVWPTIEDFRFLVDELEVLASPDELLAVAVCPWTSTGLAEDGKRFDRPGRATIVLRRADRQAPWQGAHTHFSLAPGVPQRSHGQRTRAD